METSWVVVVITLPVVVVTMLPVAHWALGKLLPSVAVVHIQAAVVVVHIQAAVVVTNTTLDASKAKEEEGQTTYRVYPAEVCIVAGLRVLKAVITAGYKAERTIRC